VAKSARIEERMSIEFVVLDSLRLAVFKECYVIFFTSLRRVKSTICQLFDVK